MGEANVQTQNIANSPQPTPHTHPIIANSPPQSPICDHQNQEVVEPTELFSMLHLTNGHRQPPCSAASSNPMKRRSPPSSSSSGEPCAKKLFCDQEDLTLSGFYLLSSHSPQHQLPPQQAPPLPPRFRRSVSDISAPSP